jgi:hypothetical protein
MKIRETLKTIKERLMNEKKDSPAPATPPPAPKSDKERLADVERKLELLNQGQHW